MIRKFRLKVVDFVSAYLPPHLRRPNRLALFAALLEPFKVLSESWTVFRNLAVTAANVTGETASLEWYLNRLYDPTLKRIQIDTAPPGGLVAGVEGAEPTLFLVAGEEATEPTVFVSAGLPGESNGFGACDFIIKRPAALAAQDAGITKTTNSYRAAGKLFQIVTV